MMDWPDVEGALRTYLRADTGIQTALGGSQRVFLEVPHGATEATFPLITVARIGGPQAPGEAPLDLALVAFDCWGSLDGNGRPRWLDLMAVVNALRSALDVIDGRTTLSSDVDGFGVQVAGVVRTPDPENGRPRYTVTTEVAVIHS